MDSRCLKNFCQPEPAALALLEKSMIKLGLSARAYSRILKIARTIADLAVSEAIESAHLAEAIQYRRMSLGQ